MGKMSDQEVMITKLNLMSCYFKKTIAACAGYHDDRELFVNMYNNLEKAVREFYSHHFESPTIYLGFSEIYAKRIEELKEHEKSLKERNMI
jgi:hypothetical protein